MSDMSSCNYCRHRESLRRWRAEGIKVEMRNDPLLDDNGRILFAGGVRCVDACTGEDLGVWYAELPDHCTC